MGTDMEPTISERGCTKKKVMKEGRKKKVEFKKVIAKDKRR